MQRRRSTSTYLRVNVAARRSHRADQHKGDPRPPAHALPNGHHPFIPPVLLSGSAGFEAAQP